MKKMPDNQIAFYQSPEGSVSIEVLYAEENIWLTQKRMAELFGCSTDNISLHLKNFKELRKNLEQHCIPETIFDMTIDDYEDFLDQRRRLMAKKIENFYKNFNNDINDENKDDINDYIALISGGENDSVEFKSSLRWDYNQKNTNKVMEYIIAKTISAFLNSNGGKLLIGVSDDGKILGLENDYKTVKSGNKDGFLLQLTQIINNYLGKEFNHYISIRIIEIDGRD
ncbi:hypothetical protein COX68_03935, partial [Candidatus Falkowbacteria bacterium CG_4_10_14_0_2_um_filter_41_15]